MSPTPDAPPADTGIDRPRCPAPADFAAEVAAYDRDAVVGRWHGPRYAMTYRVLGAGPPLILMRGIASTYRSYALLLNRLATRFRTVLYDYPGEEADDGARLGRITHEHLVDDVFGLIDHLNIGRAFLVGISFGSTVLFRTLLREPRRFPKAAVQGGFAHRRFTPAERVAQRLGRLVPGRLERLPLRKSVLTWNSKPQFPAILADRWEHYVAENGRTRIAGIAHRIGLLTRLDLRPILPKIPTEILLLHGNEDRIVPRRHFEELAGGLPNARPVVMPLVGHQPHYTHAEALALTIGDYFLPCRPEGCPNDPGRAEGGSESR